MIVAAGVLVWTTFGRQSQSPPLSRTRPVSTIGKEENLPDKTLSVAARTTEGDPAAKVALIVFSDFQCPFCGRFATQVLPSLRERYVGRGAVHVVFRHLPIPSHVEARSAATSAVCAGDQGKFTEMHDRLFAPPTPLSQPLYSSLAQQLSLNEAAFRSCLDSLAVRAAIDADVALAATLEVKVTPTVFVGIRQADGTVKATRRIRGAMPLSEFEEAIESALGRSK
jgi:protein-disulfide isomerase